jgi:pyruvate-formate lyase-activating enzyme
VIEVIEAENKGKVEVYFRTTVVPGLVGKEDILEIAKFIAKKGGKRYILQQYHPRNLIDKRYEKIRPYPKEILEELADSCSKFVKTTVVN